MNKLGASPKDKIFAETSEKVMSTYNSEHVVVNHGKSADPPLEIRYKHLLDNLQDNVAEVSVVVEECELPLIDLKQLAVGDKEVSEACKKQIAGASKEWGFFQVINHGIPRDLIERMRAEQEKLFKKPFNDKESCCKDLKFSGGSYRWGTPSATNLKQLSWSEAFHVQIADILASPTANTLSLIPIYCGSCSSMEQFASKVSELAQQLAGILAEEISEETRFFKKQCLPTSCYLRLNRYPPCPISYNHMMGIIPHTDSDFLTILYQDNVGGLQLVKDGTWFAVKPNPEVLIVNIGDLLQAWSNNVYKSVEHRVVANAIKERFSISYFLCPSLDTVIKSGAIESSRIYTSFSFWEYKKQVKEDVQIFGHKVGLPRFLVSSPVINQ